ncbi:MAG: hypothetical protein H0X02_11375 [Nitrosomonas sp.]|nr:hypothetical protein [Nitrosomonas sp.]
MGIFGKLIASSLTTIFACIGLVVSGYAWLIHDMEARDEAIVQNMRIERSAQIGVLKEEIIGVKTLVQSVDGKVDILLHDRKN